ncbi:MAG: hypothetical protein J2P13_01985 [Acidobacteria bacterium]|nr:hypothetical protein [Acidobacteriota bacterium]
MAETFDNSTPQFTTAEYAGRAGSEHCQFCKQPVGSRYYRVNAAMACASCGERAQHERAKDSHSLFTRALVFGIGAAILGLVLYAVFAIATGLVVGYLSLAVGYIVGKAIKMGSKGAGGRRYQIAAVLLTYAAVSLAAIPIGISYAKEKKTHQTRQEQSQADSGGAPSAPVPGERSSLGGALLQLTFLGLASPFVELAGDPFHGLIGLVILSVGIRIAWQLTAGPATEIFGPFETAAPAT